MKALDRFARFVGILDKRLFRALEAVAFRDVQALLDSGANPNAIDPKGETPLCRLAGSGVKNPTQLITFDFKGHQRLIRLLLERGAEINGRNKDGATPLHKAASSGHVEILRFLLEQGADTDASDSQGRRPIHPASFFGRTEAVEALVEAGADVNAADEAGRTPLAYAKQYESLRHFLRERGAR